MKRGSPRNDSNVKTRLMNTKWVGIGAVLLVAGMGFTYVANDYRKMTVYYEERVAQLVAAVGTECTPAMGTWSESRLVGANRIAEMDTPACRAALTSGRFTGDVCGPEVQALTMADRATTMSALNRSDCKVALEAWAREAPGSAAQRGTPYSKGYGALALVAYVAGVVLVVKGRKAAPAAPA